ncbi:MAG: four helix bundle protein [Terracidiphilus sp.]
MGESFKDLLVCQKAMELAREIYRLTDAFPDLERFGLTGQMRRAAVSVPSNVAEGYARSSTGEYVLFLGHGRGSCAELETQLLLSRSLGFGKEQSQKTAMGLCADTGRLLHALMQSLKPR